MRPQRSPSFVRPDIERLAAYVPGEQPRDGSYIKLNTNENPYPPSPVVLDAIRANVNADLRLYPDPIATALRAKAAAVYGFPPEGILAGNGSDDLLTIVMRACAGPGDKVAYPCPTYSLYETLVAIQGATAVEVPFPEDFRLPVDRLAGQDHAVTLVCNPNAPSGTLAPIGAIEELARNLRGLLVVDEAYADFASDTALPLARRHRNVIVLRTFSKSFSLCGLRIGLAFGHPDVIASLAKVKDSYNVNKLGLIAAESALGDYAWMEANAARVCSARDSLTEGLRKLGFHVLPSEANFVLARSRGRDARSLHEKLKERRVLVRYFDTPRLRDALRITVGTNDQIDTLLSVLEELAGEHLW
jgi:histidinol-phosphate aminotransferase